MKRIGIVILLVGIVAMIVAFVVSRQSTLPGGSPTPTPTPKQQPTTPLPQPTFPDNSQFLPTASYSIGALGGEFPSSVPLYAMTAPINVQAETERIAPIFGVTGRPNIVTAADGTYSMWPTLIIGPNARHVDYSIPPGGTSPVQAAEASYTAPATQLASRVLQWFPLTVAGVQYYAPEGNDLNYVTRDKATAAEVSLVPTLEGFPLIVGSPSTSRTVVRYSSQGKLLYYSGYVYPKPEKKEAVPILSVAQASTRLTDGRGVMLSAVSPQDLNAHDTKWYQFSLVSVRRVELVYYFDFAKFQLSPVFLFYGTAADKTTGKQVDTVTAVSAIP